MTKWVLFVALIATLPVPYYLGGFEQAPTLRLSFFAALMLAVVATEGVGGFQGWLALLGVVQSALWLALLLAVASLSARALYRFAPTKWRTPLLAGLAAALIGLASFEIYETPMSSQSRRSNWTGIFD